MSTCAVRTQSACTYLPISPTHGPNRREDRPRTLSRCSVLRAQRPSPVLPSPHRCIRPAPQQRKRRLDGVGFEVGCEAIGYPLLPPRPSSCGKTFVPWNERRSLAAKTFVFWLPGPLKRMMRFGEARQTFPYSGDNNRPQNRLQQICADLFRFLDRLTARPQRRTVGRKLVPRITNRAYRGGPQNGAATRHPHVSS